MLSASRARKCVRVRSIIWSESKPFPGCDKFNRGLLSAPSFIRITFNHAKGYRNTGDWFVSRLGPGRRRHFGGPDPRTYEIPVERSAGRPGRGPARRADCHRIHRHATRARSEEHTSELQSLTNLVCRLLL